MLSGAKTATRATLHKRTHTTSPAWSEPFIRPRAAEARCVIGFTLTKARTHPGIVDGSTNTLLAKVNGNSTVMLICMTDSGVCSFRPRAVQTHDRLKENTS